MDLRACAAEFAANESLRLQYGWEWRGPDNAIIGGLTKNATTQITREGCLAVCGGGADVYV